MLKFYDIDDSYVRFLQKYDRQVPNITYAGNNKFLCGIVLSINGCDYYAPVSSNTQVYRTSYPIKDSKGLIVATIRFCFMFPAPMSVLTEKDFKKVRLQDNAYADLLLKEWNDCNANELSIVSKASSVYRIGCNKSHQFNYTCCDFFLLEQKMNEYVSLKIKSESGKE